MACDHTPWLGPLSPGPSPAPSPPQRDRSGWRCTAGSVRPSATSHRHAHMQVLYVSLSLHCSQDVRSTALHQRHVCKPHSTSSTEWHAITHHGLVHCRPGLHQRLHHRNVAVLAGDEQRGPSVCCLPQATDTRTCKFCPHCSQDVRSSASPQRHARTPHSESTSSTEWHAITHRGLVHCRPVLHQRLHHRNVTLIAGDVQRGGTIRLSSHSTQLGFRKEDSANHVSTLCRPGRRTPASLTSTPASNSALTTSTWPFWLAVYRGLALWQAGRKAKKRTAGNVSYAMISSTRHCDELPQQGCLHLGAPVPLFQTQGWGRRGLKSELWS